MSFLIGFFMGAALGALIMALMEMAKQEDEPFNVEVDYDRSETE